METAIINNQEIVNNEAAVNNESVGTLEKIVGVVKTVRYFAPIISTVGAVLFMLSKSSTIGGFGVLLMLIGFGIALTVCPLKLLAFPFKCIPAGFKIFRSFIPFYGVADLVAALVGTITGFAVGLFLTLMVPAYFTIKKYLANKED